MLIPVEMYHYFEVFYGLYLSHRKKKNFLKYRSIQFPTNRIPEAKHYNSSTII